MSDDAERLTRFLSDPGTEPGWISPTGVEESVDQLVEEGYSRVNDSYSGDTKTVYDICCGGAAISRELIEKSGDTSMKVTGVDLNPPQPVKEMEDSYESFKLRQEDVIGFLHGKTEEADLVYAIDAFQEFEEFEAVAKPLTDSIKTGGVLVFNSIDGLQDVFRQMEGPDDSFVREKDSGREIIATDSVRMEPPGVEAPVVQKPREYVEYVRALEELGMNEISSGTVRADTGSVPEIAESIGAEPGEFNDLDLSYRYGVMEKGEKN